jgi:hypothetical protein
MYSVEFLRRSVNQKRREKSHISECASFYVQSKPSKTTSTAASTRLYKKPLLFIEIVDGNFFFKLKLTVIAECESYCEVR